VETKLACIPSGARAVRFEPHVSLLRPLASRTRGWAFAGANCRLVGVLLDTQWYYLGEVLPRGARGRYSRE
jgi:hypothetical protein